MWYLLPTGAGTSWAARHVSGRILTRTGHVSCAWFCDHEETVLKRGVVTNFHIPQTGERGAYKDASRRQSQSDQRIVSQMSHVTCVERVQSRVRQTISYFGATLALTAAPCRGC